MDEEFVEPEMPMQLKKSGGFESMGLIPPVYHAIKKKGYSVPTPI
jgi:ATP-dependent RNA helicase DDX54/DBP10